MDKPITKDAHGLIDYGYALIVPLLPEIAGFEKENRAKLICRGLGAGALAYTLFTNARWGIVRILPFNVHLSIDLAASCLAIASPWLFGFSHHRVARNTLIGTGIVGIVATCLTNAKDDQYTGQRHLFI